MVEVGTRDSHQTLFWDAPNIKPSHAGFIFATRYHNIDNILLYFRIIHNNIVKLPPRKKQNLHYNMTLKIEKGLHNEFPPVSEVPGRASMHM